jgi:hypothetical protein
MAQEPLVGQGLLIFDASRSQTYHTQYDSSGRVISLVQRPSPDNKQHSQEIDIHTPGRIRTRNLSQRAADVAGYEITKVIQYILAGV